MSSLCFFLMSSESRRIVDFSRVVLQMGNLAQRSRLRVQRCTLLVAELETEPRSPCFLPFLADELHLKSVN